MSIYRHEWKYGAADWRRDLAETFGLLKIQSTKYRVVDGEIVETVDTITEYEDPIAGVPANPDGPPDLYADGSYRADPVFQFINTHIVTTTYQATGPDSYTAQIDDFNILTGETTHRTVSINGSLPVAMTKGSVLSNLTQQPIVATLYDPCDFVSSKLAYTVEFAETEDDLSAVARRKMQRATAIVRKVTLAANPLIKIGDTVRLVSTQRLLDGLHIVVGRTITVDPVGDAKMLLELEFWTR
ncbi:MAG: hypothetical protein M3167_06290 [Acidobacteriota bacterium]|nr:hypothetical protein [Acidobacteriota bacterium]MDQ6892273.1 hypothetical protein [Acidobacteriota bacterium]